MANAETAPRPPTIVFDGVIAGQAIALTSGQIMVTNALSIDASALAGDIVISVSTNSRLFEIMPAADVTLNSLVLTSGSVSNDSGGAILNLGSLTALNCLFTNNTALGGTGQTPGSFSNGGPGGGGAGMGGAIFSDGLLLSLSNCVFTANSARGGQGGNGDGNTFTDDPGGYGGGPNPGLGGATNSPGGLGGYGGGGGGGGGSTNVAYAGGLGGFGGGGGGGGAGGRGSGGVGGVGGQGGSYGGNGGSAVFAVSGGGGGGAGLGGAVFAKTGSLTVVDCTFSSNLATNGPGGTGSFGNGNGQSGQGVGGAVFSASPASFLNANVFSGNMASTSDPDVHAALVAIPPVLTAPALLANGSAQFNFTDNPDLTFSVYASTNAALGLGQWTLLGTATQLSPGQYQFTDPAATNYPQRLYRVVWP